MKLKEEMQCARVHKSMDCMYYSERGVGPLAMPIISAGVPQCNLMWVSKVTRQVSFTSESPHFSGMEEGGNQNGKLAVTSHKMNSVALLGAVTDYETNVRHL